MVVLLTCFICPLAETFDSWDDTVQSGNDTEYALVILALCVGVSYTFARAVLRIIGSARLKTAVATDQCTTTFFRGFLDVIAEASISASPPITSLRI